MKYTGTVIKYSDHVDTDVIMPARYLNKSSPEHLAAHCMEDLDPTFGSRAQGKIIVAGRNFGTGSSREHAPAAIKYSGIQCVLADSFARIFYRNAINIAMPIVECPEAAAETKEGDEISIDLDTGVIENITTGKSYKAHPFPEFMQKLIAAGGLVNYTKQKLSAK